MTTPDRSRSSGSEPAHEPVLTADVVRLLGPRPDGLYVDCTVGLGGHTAALLEAGAGRVIGLDRDEAALAHVAARFGDAGGRLDLVHEDYRAIGAVLARKGMAMDGAIADLGVSSMQLDDPTRGFSFRAAGPLDMRMDRSSGPTLRDRLSDTTPEALADVIWRCGEERHSRRVARAILAARDRGELADTAALASVVRRAAGGGSWQRLDPATRTFQALRIWVNRELEGLDAFLAEASRRLLAGARLAVITFHSLEDRIVKHTFRAIAAAGDAWRVLTRKPIVAGDEEVARNPRARSAKLRAIERLA